MGEFVKILKYWLKTLFLIVWFWFSKVISGIEAGLKILLLYKKVNLGCAKFSLGCGKYEVLVVQTQARSCEIQT